jgi:hypothetical protein
MMTNISVAKSALLPSKEMKRGQSVLAVDDQEVTLGIAQVADHLRRIGPPEAQLFVREQENRPGNQRLGNRSFIEVYDLADFPPIQYALEGLFALFYPGDEAGHFVVAAFLGLDTLALEVVAAGKSHAIEQIGRLVRDEVKGSVFLPYSGCQHIAASFAVILPQFRLCELVVNRLRIRLCVDESIDHARPSLSQSPIERLFQ